MMDSLDEVNGIEQTFMFKSCQIKGNKAVTINSIDGGKWYQQVFNVYTIKQTSGKGSNYTYYIEHQACIEYRICE